MKTGTVTPRPVRDTEQRRPPVATPAPPLFSSFVTSVLAGLFVLSLVVTAGLVHVLAQPVSWTATSSFAVFPRATGNPSSEASYYETLARGQIVTTMAQVVTSQQRDPGTELEVLVVPETSLVTLTATAANRQEAELLAARGLRSALVAVEGLQLPFAARVVDAGPGTGARAASSAPKLMAVVVLAALVLSLAVQQAVAALGRRRA